MSKILRLLVALVLAIALGSLAFSAASATPPPGKRAVSPQAAPPAPPSENAYRSVTPCRIADTRKGGGTIANNTVRTFRIRGTASLTAQGGPGTGCGIPVGATAITANVTVTGQTGNGYLIGYAAGTPAPFTNFVSYRTGVTITVNPTLPLAAIGDEPALAIKNSGKPAHVVIDVTGYYTPPMQAYVTIEGDLFSGTARVLEAIRNATGEYTVTLDTDARYCTVAVTPGGGTNASVFAEALTGLQKDVHVYFHQSGGAPIDSDFNLIVSC